MNYVTDEITNDADILDSRDIQARYDELTGNIKTAFFDAGRELFDFLEAWKKNNDKTKKIVEILIARNLLDEDSFNEWENIQIYFIDEFGDDSGWNDGITFIRDTYMDEDWAENELKDLGYLNAGRDNNLPYIISSNIDWQGVLHDLQQDYTQFDFDGVAYWKKD